MVQARPKECGDEPPVARGTGEVACVARRQREAGVHAELFGEGGRSPLAIDTLGIFIVLDTLAIYNVYGSSGRVRGRAQPSYSAMRLRPPSTRPRARQPFASGCWLRRPVSMLQRYPPVGRYPLPLVPAIASSRGGSGDAARRQLCRPVCSPGRLRARRGGITLLQRSIVRAL